MKRNYFSLGAVVILFLAACSSGRDNVLTQIGADFTPDVANPGSETVSMQRGSTSGNLATADISVTGVDNLYAASFDVVYDPAKVDFIRYSAGTILEAGGHTPHYDVQDNGHGRLVVVAQRLGDVPGVDVAATQAVIRLTFRVGEVGVSRLDFENTNLVDDQIPPQGIAGITWSGGVLSGS